MFNKILVANDGSPGGRRAFEAAVELAKRLAAPLHMVMVEELPRFPASIDEIVEEKDEADHRFAPVMAWARAQAHAAGITIQPHLVPGHPVEAIVSLVREHRFDLLVVGFMGHSALYERIIGGWEFAALGRASGRRSTSGRGAGSSNPEIWAREGWQSSPPR